MRERDHRAPRGREDRPSPGVEFTRVETLYYTDSPTTPLREADVVVADDADFIVGRRVAELAGLSPGAASVRVTLRDESGDEVVRRDLRVRLERSLAVTIAITRSCRGVVCPDPVGDPLATTCAAGTCVPPDCGEDCAAECTSNSECTAAVDCAVALCIEGDCFGAALHERCGASEYCDPDDGCVLRDVPVSDGGTCAATESRCADGLDDECDGLVDCADDECLGARCDDALFCTDNDACDAAGVCRGLAMACDDGNPCTDDRCDDTDGCVHADNGAPCDDGVFCNGSDSCAGGFCVDHGAPPCGMFCNEVTRSCDACRDPSDCGEPSATDWSTCGGFASTCSVDGTQRRVVTTPSCEAARASRRTPRRRARAPGRRTGSPAARARRVLGGAARTPTPATRPARRAAR